MGQFYDELFPCINKLCRPCKKNYIKPFLCQVLAGGDIFKFLGIDVTTDMDDSHPNLIFP